MTAASRFERNRGLALGIARDWYIPGAEADDVRQEALIALWVAARAYDGSVPFRGFARMVIVRRLATAVKIASRKKAAPLSDSVREWDAPAAGDALSETIARERLRETVERAKRFSAAERESLRRILDGEPLAGKSDDNARQRVREKLRRAA